MSKLDFDWLYPADFKRRHKQLVPPGKLLASSVENIQNLITILILDCPNYLENPKNNKQLKILCDSLAFLNSAN